MTTMPSSGTAVPSAQASIARVVTRDMRCSRGGFTDRTRAAAGRSRRSASRYTDAMVVIAPRRHVIATLSAINGP